MQSAQNVVTFEQVLHLLVEQSFKKEKKKKSHSTNQNEG